MPTKEEIEAELQASETGKAIAKLRELIVEYQEWEAALRAAEKEVWQPHWSHNDPFRDRLLRVGMSPQEVAEAERRIAAMCAKLTGKAISADLQKELDDIHAAEKSALQQLSSLVDRAGKGAR